jgi:hypothetical protein
MSETQTEYDTEQETDAEPDFSHIHAPWHLESSDGLDDVSEGYLAVINENDGLVGYAWEDDAPIIAAAGTAAQEAREMGYDPVAVQKALPKILSAAEELLERVEDDCRVRNINPYDEPSFTALEYALKSAEGSGE